MNTERIINEGGVNGSGLGLVNTNSNDFKELKSVMQNAFHVQTETLKIENGLLALRFRMEEYLSQKEVKEIISVGVFLRLFVTLLNVKNKDLANYINYKESNLSALLRGNRKINIDLAIKFGNIFRIDPLIWLHIQTKNELIKAKNDELGEYKKYKLEDLLKNSLN
jgi:plasmid maintenance system antidote protein VapI